MLKKTSKEFRTLFLLRFTRELIKHSGMGEIFELENILKEVDKEKRLERKKQLYMRERERMLLPRSKITLPRTGATTQSSPRLFNVRKTPPQVIKIPEQKLPPQFQYLRPMPTNIEIDLGKLNPLIKDPTVKSIECNGENESIIVRTNAGSKKTKIILSEEEINQIIKKFSEMGKIPVQEGIFRVVVGKLSLSAIVSEVISSKFVIRKITPAPRSMR